MNYFVLLLVREQSWYHSGQQHVVYQFQETFIDDVSGGEQKHDLFVIHANHVVQILHVLAKRGLVVASRETNLKCSKACSVRCQFDHRLLPASAYTDHQNVAFVHPEGTMYPGQMLERVVEKDHVQFAHVSFIVILVNLKSILYQYIILIWFKYQKGKKKRVNHEPPRTNCRQPRNPTDLRRILARPR